MWTFKGFRAIKGLFPISKMGECGRRMGKGFLSWDQPDLLRAHGSLQKQAYRQVGRGFVKHTDICFQQLLLWQMSFNPDISSKYFACNTSLGKALEASRNDPET